MHRKKALCLVCICLVCIYCIPTLVGLKGSAGHDESVPMFLDPNFTRFHNIRKYGLPFGIKPQQETIVDDILSATGTYGLGEELDRLKAKRCIIVGNGGILTNKYLGRTIDTYDVVVRLNRAPVKGYERDVGSKTTMRIFYPASYPDTGQIEDQSLFVLSAFHDADLKWFRHMVLKAVAEHVPREATDMRILNPHFSREASFQLIGLPYNDGLPLWDSAGNIPTTGVIAITMALHHCDRVAVAGFGYNMNDPDASLHYYDNLKMSAVTERGNHNIVKEKQFLVKLVEAGDIQDLTMGIL